MPPFSATVATARRSEARIIMRFITGLMRRIVVMRSITGRMRRIVDMRSITALMRRIVE